MTLWFTHEYRQTSRGTWVHSRSDIPTSDAPREVLDAAKKCMSLAEQDAKLVLSSYDNPSPVLTLMWPWGVDAAK